MLDIIPIPGDLLPDRVDIYPATVGQDADGAYNPTYSSLPAQQNIPCAAQPRQVEELFDDQNRIMRFKRYHVFFNDNPEVTPRDKLIVTHSDGSFSTLFVDATRNEGGMGVYYVTRATERL